MIGQLCFYIILLASIKTSSTTCNIEDNEDNCVYSVVCENHAGSIQNTECNGQPYITFIMTRSEFPTLTYAQFGSTNFDGRVRVFKAIENTWPSIEYSTFKYYRRTLIMDLSGNKIENIANEAFLNLNELQQLNLSSNLLETLNPKTFFFVNVRSSLEVLDLSFNKLKDLSGEVFSYIPDLKILYLNDNNIVTIGEECFNNNKNLIYLFLQRNHIDSLNMTLISLKSLKVLNVSLNSLNCLLGYEINRLTSLETLVASDNYIEKIDTDCFDKSDNLQEIDLKNNKITSTIENVMFASNKNLQSLDLYHNSITRIEDNAFKYNKLRYLNLEYNNITGDITDRTFEGLHEITSLSLFNQSISSIKDNAFSNLTNLLNLNLSRNLINDIMDNSFTGQTSLKILDLSFNHLTGVNFLRNCLTNLSELYLNNNNISVIVNSTFSNQILLKKLDISKNRIKIIEQNSLPLISLQTLAIFDNLLDGDLKNNVFSPASFLRNLDLSYFKLNKICEMALVDLPLVAKLNISHNNLEYIHPKNFIRMINLYSLDVSYNKLSNLELNSTSLGNLKALYLNNNRLKNISESVLKITTLLYVDISYNEIVMLADVGTPFWPNLKVLYMSHNNVTDFNNANINYFTNLTDLDLSSNFIANINFTHFKDLVSVNLSNNSISTVNNTFLKNVDYLQVLNLSFNEIKDLSPGTFQNVKILKLLDLSHNHIKNFRYGTFRGMNRAEVLDISYNDITSIDFDVFHECIELRRLIIDYNKLTSLDIDRLLLALPKLMTLSLGGNPMACKDIVHSVRTVNKSMIRQVEITALHTVFHEDNVHGIKCGDVNSSTPVPPTSEGVSTTANSTSSTALIIWCTILTVIVVAAAIFYIYKQRARHFIRFREPNASSCSLEFNTSSSVLQSNLMD